MKTKHLLFSSLLTLAFFISCDSNDKTDDNPTTMSAVQVVVDSQIDASIDDVTNIAEDQFTIQQNSTSKSSTPIKSILPACAVVAWTIANGTFTGSIDFGTEGCALENGNILKGKITLSFSGNFTTAEQTITYTFDGFYHNGKKLQGSKTITRSVKTTDLLAEAHPVFTGAVDMTLTFEDGKVYTRTGTLTKEMTAGFDTKANWNDNVFLVTGTGQTIMPNGDTCSSTIQTPLRYEAACKKPYPVSGTILKTKNGTEGTVDFGTGECDNLVSVTINGVTTSVELKK